MKISDRVLNMQESPIRKLTPLAEKAKRDGKKVYYLNIGQPDIQTPQEFYDAIKGYNGVLTYTKSEGNDDLIKSFIEYYKRYNIDFEMEDIVVTFGGTEALILSMLATCDVGDEILVPQPLYTSYNGLASMTSIKIVPIMTYAEEAFKLPQEEDIRKLITSRTRAILLNNPSNPTGRLYTLDEMKLIAKIAKEHNLYVFADEVYREFIYDNREFISFAHFKEIEDRVIIIDSVSKRYSACGARIGSLSSKNKDLMVQILKLAQGRICPPLLDQIGAASLSKVDESFLKKSQIEYQKRRDIVFDALKEMEGVICDKPEGAFYFLAKLPIEDAEDFVIWLLKEFTIDGETTFLSPAADFYATKGLGRDEVRISYCIEQESLKRAMNIVKEGLRVYMEDRLVPAH